MPDRPVPEPEDSALPDAFAPELAGIPDEELMSRVAEDDEAAFRELVARWQTPLLNFLFRSCRDFGEAEELAQTTFVRIYRAAPGYAPTARFSTYLFHIARRLLINAHEKSRRRPSEATDPANLRAIDPGQSERTVQELEEIFQGALGAMPENHRTAILLLKQQQLSYAEIATIMQATESAVKTWIFRARQTLQQALRRPV